VSLACPISSDVFIHAKHSEEPLIPLDETFRNNRVSRSRNSQFFDIMYFQKFCLSRPGHFSHKNRQKIIKKKFAGLRPAPASCRFKCDKRQCTTRVTLANESFSRAAAKGLGRVAVSAKLSCATLVTCATYRIFLK